MSKEIIITANDLRKRLKAILRESGVDSKILNKSTGKIMKLFVSNEGAPMREKIALKVVKAIYMDRDSSQPMTDISLDIADQILSLPSGYIAGEHEITIEMALKMFGDIITDYPSYPHIGFYGGRRITKPIIPQTR